MILVNNNANLETGATTENYLKTVQYKQPEFNQVITYQFAGYNNLPLVEQVLGMGQIYTNNTKRAGYNQIGADQLSWPVMPNFTNTCDLRGVGAFVGTTMDNVARTLSFNKQLFTLGQTIQWATTTGAYQEFIILDNGTLNAGLYDYQAKYIGQGTVGAAQYGVTAGATQAMGLGQLSPEFSTTGTLLPTQPADIYTNFTSIMRYTLQISRSEAQSKIWYKGSDGQMFWVTQKEHQWRTKMYQFIERSFWYAQRTYATIAGNFYTANTPTITDLSGNTLKSGDGFFAQVDAGNITTFSYATYTNPLNYGSLITQVRSSLVAYANLNGLQSVDLMAYVGNGGYDLWQDVFKQFADTSGGGISLVMSDYQGGREITQNIKAYNVGGFRIHLKKCQTFSDPEGQTNSVSQGSSIKLADFQMVLMPQMTTDGHPLVEAYFKGGEGFDGGFFETVIPGMINPLEPGKKSTTAASGYNGYSIEWMTEAMLNVTVPKQVLWFNWVA